MFLAKIKIWQSLLILLFCVGLVLGLRVLTKPEFFPIKQVVIQADYQYVHPDELSKIVVPYTKEHNFFTFSATKIANQISSLPWIYKVNIHRLWPTKILIRIEKQQAVAIWNNQQLINVDGQVFDSGHAGIGTENSLPTLFGTEEQLPQIWQNYQTIVLALSKINLKVITLKQEPTGDWQFTLSNNIVILLGDENLIDRLNLLIKSYPEIPQDKIPNIARIDMRYSNGFAIKWR